MSPVKEFGLVRYLPMKMAPSTLSLSSAPLLRASVDTKRQSSSSET